MTPTDEEVALTLGLDYRPVIRDRRKRHELYVPIEAANAGWRRASIESRERVISRTDKHNNYHSEPVLASR